MSPLAVRNWFNPNLVYTWFIVPGLSGILAFFSAAALFVLMGAEYLAMVLKNGDEIEGFVAAAAADCQVSLDAVRSWKPDATSSRRVGRRRRS